MSGDDRVPVARKPEDIIIVVAGGGARHLARIGVFGNGRSVSRRIRPARKLDR